MLKRSAHARGSWLRVVPSVAAASLLATLSFASLCLCSDEPVLVRPSLEGCGLAAQRYVEVAASADSSGDACLGPCVDVRILVAGAQGDDRPPVAAPATLAAPHWAASDRSLSSPFWLRPRDGRRAAEHLDYTILRC